MKYAHNYTIIVTNVEEMVMAMFNKATQHELVIFLIMIIIWCFKQILRLIQWGHMTNAMFAGYQVCDS